VRPPRRQLHLDGQRTRGQHPHDHGQPITPPLVWTIENPVLVRGDELFVDLKHWRQRPRDVSTLAVKLEPIDRGDARVYPMVAANSSDRRARAHPKEDGRQLPRDRHLRRRGVDAASRVGRAEVTRDRLPGAGYLAAGRGMIDGGRSSTVRCGRAAPGKSPGRSSPARSRCRAGSARSTFGLVGTLVAYGAPARATVVQGDPLLAAALGGRRGAVVPRRALDMRPDLRAPAPYVSCPRTRRRG